MRSAVGLDEDLYASFLSQGDQAALEELEARWRGAAYRVARSICGNHAVAEEAVQDTFLKLVSGKARFRSRHPGSFRAWLLTLAANSARMARRQELRAEARKQIQPRDFAVRKGLDSLPEQGGRGPHWGSVLPLTLAGMEERWRTPIVLYYLNGMRLKEIAGSSGVSQQMISKRLSDGLKRLRARMLSQRVGEREAV